MACIADPQPIDIQGAVPGVQADAHIFDHHNTSQGRVAFACEVEAVAVKLVVLIRASIAGGEVCGGECGLRLDQRAVGVVSQQRHARDGRIGFSEHQTHAEILGGGVWLGHLVVMSWAVRNRYTPKKPMLWLWVSDTRSS